MKLSYEDHDTITVLTISGDLTVDQVDAFRRSCQERFTAGIRHVVLDMEYLTLLDSAGLEALLWIIDEGAQHGGQLRLVRPDPTVRKILEVSRLDRRFDIHESIESAAKSLR
ncbi:MAG: STAS domain-containing protein [Planctomycetota bacterium]|jgi:anti-anti-sigma factor